MLEFIVGFVLGFWVACNHEENVKGYWEKLKTWFKEKLIMSHFAAVTNHRFICPLIRYIIHF